jgi:putative intracellular protease/amidase/methionine-rich copper-binding protein CopC
VRALYLSTVLDPLQKEEGEVQLPLEKQTQKLRVGILLYPGFEMLDVYGPLQMWAYIPDFEVSLIAENPGPVNSAQQFATVANYGFADAPALDILMVPGGMGTFAQLNNPKLLEFIQKADKTTQLTSSVCTGSAILAKAGVLSGQKATTNKRFFFLSEQQTNDVQWIESARWVQSGKYFTSSGVTAGTDMALGLIAHLYGHDKAAELASSLEYQWQSDSSKDPFAQFIQRQQVQASGPVALSKVEPAAEQVITGESPRFIQIYFNKAPEVAKSDISMLDAKGRSIQLRGLHTMGSNDLMILIQEPLTSGRYQVKWQASFGGLDQSKQASEQLSGDYWFEYRH